MKTTSGKTKAVRPPARAVQIVTGDDRARMIAVRSASTLKQALLEYCKETLEPKGFTKPKVQGNVLIVLNEHGVVKKYVALEKYQTPIKI